MDLPNQYETSSAKEPWLLVWGGSQRMDLELINAESLHRHHVVTPLDASDARPDGSRFPTPRAQLSSAIVPLGAILSVPAAKASQSFAESITTASLPADTSAADDDNPAD